MRYPDSIAKRKLTLAALAAAATLLVFARHRAVDPPVDPIDFRRSLVITRPEVISGFEFQRVLQTLIDRSGATTTPLELYRQWFDTQNPKPGLAVANAPHCDDFMTDGRPSFNGFPRRCPTPEGALATSDPFTAHDYIPIGVTNRIDLAPQDGSNCGEYRIIFAKATVSPGDRLHVIFEGILPNPHPEQGLAACRPVARFWAGLTNTVSADERRERLEQFFFDGIDGFEPLLMPAHFDRASGGGIRTAQLSGPRRITRFYQFHLETVASRLLVVPGVLENLAWGQLFNASQPAEIGAEFRQFFLSQVPTLAIDDVNGFFDRIPEKFLIAESDPVNDTLAFASEGGFNAALSTPEGQAFGQAIAAELQRAGSTLKVPDVLVRADLQNCAGCHLGNAPIGDGLAFPGTFHGMQIDETMETVGGVARYTISPALRDVFAPNRVKILRDFLAGRPLPQHSN